LGRKNRLFLIDLDSSESVEYSSVNFPISSSSIFTDKNKTYYNKFTSLDRLGIVTELLSALEDLGVALHDQARCRFSLDQIDEIKETSLFKDGNYYYEGEEISEEELDDEADELNSAFERMDSAIETIQKYFPNAEISDFNTGNY